ncbi:hypothetical protein H0H87_003015 [Tephrocybe sp. NHM501043]|nr:hypothetical protein H0H87_003015 [Tephrocybe sp. NHM501043]
MRYQATVNAFKKEGYSGSQAEDLMIKNVRLADKARTVFINECVDEAPIVKIALSIGPFGATLAPAQEFDGYYPPPYGPMGYSETESTRNSFDEEDTEGEQTSIDALSQFHLDRLLVFARNAEAWEKIDIIAFETIPLMREAVAIRKAMLGLGNALATEKNIRIVDKAWWMSFVFPAGRFPQKSIGGQHRTVHDILHNVFSLAMTSDNKPLPIPTGIGINCTAPKHLFGLLQEFHHVMAGLHNLSPSHPWLVLYPDGGDSYDIKTCSWKVSSEDAKRSWAIDVTDALKVVLVQQECRTVWGGIVVGGCCRAGPDLIGELRGQIGPLSFLTGRQRET